MKQGGKLRLLAGALAFFCALLCACGQGAGRAAGPTAQMQEWAQAAKLNAEETPLQLYQAALEEGTLVVYSTSTRVIEAAQSFEAQYPGLVVEIFDLRSPDIKDLLLENRESGIPLCDVVVCADNDGLFSQSLIPEGILYKYTPQDIAPQLLYDAPDEALFFLGEGEIAFYNSRLWGEAPFTNWWQLTEPEFFGKVYMPDPFRSDSAYGFMATIATRPELMAEAYEARYGRPLEAGVHAGEEFVRRLVQNGLVLRTSSDDVMEAVGAPGIAEPRVGIVISSKMRHNDIGYNLEPMQGLAPFDGVFAPNSISIAGGSHNVNGAKLFIRWVLGEADGAGAGIEPFLQKGAFSVRGDVAGPWDALMHPEDLILLDRAQLYANAPQFQQLWLDAVAGRTP